MGHDYDTAYSELLSLRPNGKLTVGGVVNIGDGSPTDPAFGFSSNAGLGVYRSGPNTLGFATGSSERLTINSSGVLEVHTTNYETLVTADDHIPNKKYVDDAIASSGGITTYPDVATAETATGSDNDICYVVSLETFFRYEASSTYTRDGQNILNTGDGGTTRWHAVAGGLPYKTSFGSTIVAIGESAANTQSGTATGCVAIGYNALRDADNSAYYNVAIGYQSMQAASGLDYCIGIGYRTLNATSGSYHIAIGYLAGYSVTTGAANIAIGAMAGYNITSGTGNVAIGYEAGRTIYGGGSGTYVGYQAGRSANGQYGNTIIGYQAGYSGALIHHSVFLGYKAGYYETNPNMLYISNSDTSNPLIKGDFSVGSLEFNSDGQAQSTSFRRVDTLSAAADVVSIDFVGKDNAGNDQTYANITVSATDPTDGTEKGKLTVTVPDGAGATTEAAEITEQGLGLPAGGYATPALYYKDDPDVGLYFSSNQGSLAAGGTHCFQWASSYFKSAYAGGLLLRRNPGTAAEPTYSFPAATGSSTSVNGGMYYDITTGELRFSHTSTDIVTITASAVNFTQPLQMSGTQVVTTRQTGWTAEPGTSVDRTSTGAHAAQTISDPPTQAQVQNIDDDLVKFSERLAALIYDLQQHGLIGA